MREDGTGQKPPRSRWLTLRRVERGATTVEYLGVLVVVAAIVGGIAATPLGSVIGSGLSSAICRIVGTGCADPVTTTGSGSSTTGSGGNSNGAAAHDTASTGSGNSGSAHGGCSNPFTCTLGFAGSLVYNVGKGVLDDVSGVVHVVTDPGSLIDAGTYIGQHPVDAVRQLVVDDETIDKWKAGDHGGAIGRTIWNVASWFIPYYDLGKAGAKIGELGKLGKLGKAADEAGKLADIARVGELATDAERALSDARKAAQAGDQAAARAAAEAARKAAKDAEERAAKLGCPIALGDLTPTGGGLHGPPAAAAAPLAVLRTDGCTEAADAAKKADRAADAAEALANPSTVKGALGDAFAPGVHDPAGEFEPKERAIADYLAEHGARVDQRAADHTVQDLKNPDAMVRWSTDDPGTITEFKTLGEGGTNATTAVKRNLLDGVGQSADKVVVIDGRPVGLTLEDATTGWKRAVGEARDHQKPMPDKATIILADGTYVEFP